MYERVDTSSIVEIEHDPVVMVALILASLAFVVLGWWLAFHLVSARAVFMGWATMSVFGLFTILGVRRLLTMRGPVLTISPQGVCDRRFSEDLVAWSGVTAVGEWKYRTNRMVTLSLAPGVEGKLRRSRFARLMRWPDKAPGAGGMTIPSIGLKASFCDIRNLITAFAKAHANLDPSPSSRPVRQS
jgi:hypothetical protein